MINRGQFKFKTGRDLKFADMIKFENIYQIKCSVCEYGLENMIMDTVFANKEYLKEEDEIVYFRDIETKQLIALTYEEVVQQIRLFAKKHQDRLVSVMS